MKNIKFLALALAVAVPFAGQAVVFTGTGVNGGYTLKAKADFSWSAGLLTVKLTNLAPTAADVPAHTLSGLFFNLTGNPGMTKNNAAIGSGSTLVHDPGGVIIGDHYAFKSGITFNGGTINVANAYGISSVGLGIFSPGDTFTGNGGSVNGDDYNIISAAGHLSHPQLNSNPMVKDTMVYQMNLASFSEDMVKNVKFHYSSATSGETLNAVPEPATMSLIGLALIPALRRRKAN